jgi:hypothetical protein
MSVKARAKNAAVKTVGEGGKRTPSLRELEDDEPQGHVRDENPLWSLFDQLASDR